jgi:hypothetical protein
MADLVMAILLQTGGLSLRELFARIGDQLGNRLRLATLLKTGEVRLELASPDEEAGTAEALEKLRAGSSEEEIAQLLENVTFKPAANNIAIVPTLKAWRNPYAAA